MHSKKQAGKPCKRDNALFNKSFFKNFDKNSNLDSESMSNYINLVQKAVHENH